jgi:hypothetical protein
MEVTPRLIEATVTEIGHLRDRQRWGVDTGWDPRDYWHLVELGEICRVSRHIK